MIPTRDERNQMVQWVRWAADALAMLVLPISRTRFGVEGIGGAGALALGGLLVVLAGTRSDVVLAYLLFWLLMCASHRARAVRAERTGEPYEHSRYTGWPWLVMRFVPFLRSEITAKQFWEPVFWFLLGTALANAADPGVVMLGKLFAFASFGIFVGTAIDVQIERMQLRRMRDGVIEQMVLTERYRRGRLE